MSLGRAWATVAMLGVVAVGGTGCSLFRHEVPAVAVQEERPYLVLRLSERRLYLHAEDPAKPPESFRVAIGKKPWETPTGRFRINEMVENPDFLLVNWKNPAVDTKKRIPPGLNNPLGLRWIGFAEAHGWNIGFHGTTKTEALGQAVSHGCVRMSNPDVVKLYKEVRLGTPVIVEP